MPKRARSILTALNCSAAMLCASTAGTARAALPTLRQIIETKAIDSLAVSPDGRSIAFRVVSRSIDANLVSGQWYRARVDGTTPPEALGRPAAPAFEPEFDIIVNGMSQWSPDGTSLYVLGIDEDGHQVHRLGPSQADERVTNDLADILTFTLSPDGSELRYTTRNDRSDIVAAQDRQEREGVRIDRTIYSEGLRLTGNFLDGSRTATIRRAGPPYAPDHAIDAFAGPERSKVQQLDPAPRTIGSAKAGPIPVVTVALGDEARTIDAEDGAPAIRVVPSAPDTILRRVISIEIRQAGVWRRCPAFFCQGTASAVRQVMRGAGGEVVVLYEPASSGRMGLYGWDPRSGQVRTILAPTNALDGGSVNSGAGCSQAGSAIICVEAGASRPPRLVRIDLASGAVVPLLDPNHDLDGLGYGDPRFLEWDDASGRRWNGYLMTPKAAPGRLPLVITTYRCRGSFRGGTSNLAPEYALVARGFAVMCVNTSLDLAAQTDEAGNFKLAGSVRGALEGYAAIIAKLAAEGKIDPKRVGISGHSASGNAVAYAISHSNIFATAIIGGGITLDPWSFAITAPTADSWRAEVIRYLGLPRPSNDPAGLWAQVSPALNAKRISASLLIQPPENEWYMTLQLFTAMQDAGKAVDMVVYPREGHDVGREPGHQYMRALRSIAWFDSWLRDGAAARAELPLDAARWRAMKRGKVAPTPR